MHNMLGNHTQQLPHMNIIPPIWTHLIKSDGTKKAYYVCNGSSSWHKKDTLAHRYAPVLNQSGAPTFWAITTLHNYKAYVADATFFCQGTYIQSPNSFRH